MLFAIEVALVVLWMSGQMTGMTMGGAIHILPVIALTMVVVDFIAGRKRV